VESHAERGGNLGENYVGMHHRTARKGKVLSMFVCRVSPAAGFLTWKG
jgi:hypothetical protein